MPLQLEDPDLTEELLGKQDLYGILAFSSFFLRSDAYRGLGHKSPMMRMAELEDFSCHSSPGQASPYFLTCM